MDYSNNENSNSNLNNDNSGGGGGGGGDGGIDTLNHSMAMAMSSVEDGGGDLNYSIQQSPPPPEFPVEILTQFSMKNVRTCENGEQVPLPIEVSRYLATYNLKDKKNKEVQMLRNELNNLEPMVKQCLSEMEGNELQLQNLSSHESSLFGPRGKLKYVERTRKVDKCTREVMNSRLKDFTEGFIPSCTAEQAEIFAKQAVVYIWEGIESKTTYVLERTMPKKRVPGKKADRSSTLMNDL